MQEQVFDLAALITFEVGKNRLEALGDAQETIDFLRYYAEQMTENNGFVRELSSLSENEHNVSVLRPWGVWGVISPFNFPLALSAGPSIGALITGNTVVIKPSNAGALMALEFHRVMTEAGLPSGALHIVTGGDQAGDYLASNWVRAKMAVLVLALAGLVASGARADESGIRQGFKSKFPKMNVESVGNTPFRGIFEVVVDGKVFYTDAKVSYLFSGDLLDVRGEPRNLTDEANAKIAAVALTAVLASAPASAQECPTIEALRSYRPPQATRVFAMGEDVFLQAADLYRASRRAGLTVRSGVDCLIAASAIRHHLEVLHHDRDYDAIAKISTLRARRVKL